LWANGIQYKTIQDFEKIEENGKSDFITTIEFYRGNIVDRASFKWSDAVRAGWTTKDNWTKMPRHMLYARALALGAQRIAPDKILGLYTVEEMADVVPNTSNVVINEEGDVTIK
jgi:hypothetical protein